MDVYLFLHCSCHFFYNPAMTAALMHPNDSTSFSSWTIGSPATALRFPETRCSRLYLLLNFIENPLQSSVLGCRSSWTQLCITIAIEFWSAFPVLPIPTLSFWCSSVGSTETLPLSWFSIKCDCSHSSSSFPKCAKFTLITCCLVVLTLLFSRYQLLTNSSWTFSFHQSVRISLSCTNLCAINQVCGIAELLD